MTDAFTRLAATLADRYRIERELGEGGMATVYLAEDLKHHRMVAIKVLKPELAAVLGAERFVQEITTTAQLQHPNILPLFDSGEADGFLYYVMPYVEGESLRDKLDRERQLGVDEAVGLIREVADGLQYAHEHGVVHRDIKPENILIHAGRPMVADFGIALAVSAAAGGRMTETGLSLGTPHYMSPEQATAEKTITNRSDVYSLASVLYEMLTGDPPHTGSSAQQIIVRIIADEARPVGDVRKSVPPNVAAAVAKALEKLPADRFESTKAFADALADPGFTHSRDRGGRGVAVPAAGRARRWGAVAAALVLGAAGGLWIGTHASDAHHRVASLAVDLDPGDSLTAGHVMRLVNANRPWVNALALSPDGRTLVFAGSRDGRPSLLRRSLATGETTPIPGTDSALAPFFSPDGHSIGFWAGRWLERVPLEGGTPVQIAQVNWPEGASWGDDGRIVYAGYLTGLYRVSSSGGPVDSLPAEPRAHLPWVLPGSRTVLYTVSYGDGPRQRRIESLDLKTGVRDTVLDDAADARYLPGGYLAFARVGQLMVAPFDPSSVRITGAPTGVTPDLMQAIGGGAPRTWTDAAQYTFSRRGDLAWVSGGITPPSKATAVILDRHGTEAAVDAPRRGYLAGRFSPDGRHVALSSPRAGEAGIWVVDLDRPGSARDILPSDRGEDVGQVSAFFAWSPDGTRIVSGGGDSLIILSTAGGSPPKRIGRVSGYVPAQWLPGDTILMVTWNGAAGGEIAEVPVAGGAPRIMIRETGRLGYPTVSPDGRWLAYAAFGGGRPNVVLRRWPSLGGRQVVAPGAAPVWSRGGEELLYQGAGAGPALMAVEVGPDGSVGQPRVVLHRGLAGAHPLRGWDVTADGARILTFSRDTIMAPPAPVIHVLLNWFEGVKEGPR